MSSRITDHTLESLHNEYQTDMEGAKQLLLALERKYAGRGTSILQSRDDAERTQDARQAFEQAATQYFMIEDNFSVARAVLRPGFTTQALTLLPAMMKMARKTLKLKKPKITKKHGLPVITACRQCMHCRQTPEGFWCELAGLDGNGAVLELGSSSNITPPKECPLRKIEE